MADDKVLISPCKICGKVPGVYQTPVMTLGTTFTAYVVECQSDIDEIHTKKNPPFVEHTLCVYGSTKEEAIERWEKIAND